MGHGCFIVGAKLPMGCRHTVHIACTLLFAHFLHGPIHMKITFSHTHTQTPPPHTHTWMYSWQLLRKVGKKKLKKQNKTKQGIAVSKQNKKQNKTKQNKQTKQNLQLQYYPIGVFCKIYKCSLQLSRNLKICCVISFPVTYSESEHFHEKIFLLYCSFWKPCENCIFIYLQLYYKRLCVIYFCVFMSTHEIH